METLALEVKHLTLAWIKAHVGTKGNEQADQAAKEGAAGGLHMKETRTPIPWCAVPINGHTGCCMDGTSMGTIHLSRNL